MKNAILILISIIGLCLFYAFTHQQKTVLKQTKAQVLVLGSYHMNNPGADVYNMESDDVLAPKRQAEIKDLVAVLAKFKPTKIAIERAYGGKTDSIEQENYRQYVAGTRKLNRNENEQIGFRLAKQLGHSQIYCVDDRGVGFPYGEMVDYATKNNQMNVLARGQKFAEKFMKTQVENLNKMTVRQFLKQMNQPAYLKSGHSFYMDFCKVGKGQDYPGADLVADWYKRNIRIFSNINKVTTSSEDRILVIFGAGHAPILRELIDYAEDYELVEAIDYL